MCGILGCVGETQVVPIIMEGLKRLEYRGYDSAGLAYFQNGKVSKHRCEGKLANLEIMLSTVASDSCIGLGHTRWATHGSPTVANAHPHSDCSGDIEIVHNGIIENYHSLREELQRKGHFFKSDTDTEVLAHLIEEKLTDDLAEAVRLAVKQVTGSFAIGAMWTGQPDRLVAVRSQSPLVLGMINGSRCFLASDISALLPYTSEVIFLDDNELAVLERGTLYVMAVDTGELVLKEPQKIEWNAHMAEKSGYEHFMLKEIFEQPQAIRNTFCGRIDRKTGTVTFSELGLAKEELAAMKRVSLVACGTSWHAALVAKYWLEKVAGVPTEVDIASEFRYRRLLLDEEVLVVPISQSGETADTLAGMRLAKSLDAKIIAVCNVVGSTVTREADGTIYTHAGPEIGVASTKAFTSQLVALFLLTLALAQAKNTISEEKSIALADALFALPALLEKEMPRMQQEMNGIAAQFQECRDFLFLGRGANYPIALEGALKLKEISYIHAEGYAAGELKHGPIALIDQDMPVLALVPRDSVHKKVLSNVEEVKARRGRIIVIGTHNDEALCRLGDHVLYLPEIDEALNPILYTIPLQFLAYQIAKLRGCDVDQPRNLAKSVTVE